MRAILFFAAIALLSAPLRGQRGDWYNDEGGYAFQGTGTKEDPYLISSETAFTFLAEQVNMWPGKSFQAEYFLLTEDLDLGAHYWIPIGSEPHQPFRGIFNGNGKRICNLYIGKADEENVYAAAGLFGHLGKGAKIENLTLDGGAIVGGGRELVSCTGSLAGYVLCSVSEEEDSVVIRNCHNRNVQITGADTEAAYTGGLIGEAYAFSDGNGSALVLVDECTNSGAVAGGDTAFPYTGGIAGKGHGRGYCDGAAASVGTFILRACVNRGRVTGGKAGAKDAISSTGGLLGFGYGSGDGYGKGEGTGVFRIEYCLNAGSVAGGDAAGPQAFSYTGGIFGYGDGYGFADKPANASEAGHGSGAFSIRASANRGAVRAGRTLERTALSASGGIAGFASGSAAGEGYGSGSFSMRNCYSYASVAGAQGFVGGLAGWLATSGNGAHHAASAVVQNSYAAGSINRGDTLLSVVAGGIAGRVRQSKEAVRAPLIENCLAALSYLNGAAGKTFRIAGQLQGVRRALAGALNRNYACVEEGEWVESRTVKNGYDWNRSMLNVPVAYWNTKEIVWEIVEDGQALMPSLRNVAEQGFLPVP